MIRWSYLLPRLLLVGVLALAVWLTFDRVLHWAIESTGKKLVGAKVEVGRVETSLAGGELRLGNVRIANPDAPMKNLVEARELVLSIEPEPLGRKKYVVREGRASGVRFNTDRDTSGEVGPQWEWVKKISSERIARFAHPWVAGLPDLVKQELAEQADGLESVRLGRELGVRWPAEYRQMEDRVDSVKLRVERLRGLFEKGSDRLLENLQAFDRGIRDVEAIKREIDLLPGEVKRLKEQALRDKQALLTAKDRDLERLKKLARPETFLDPENLSEFLLGPEIGPRVVNVVEWVQWGRDHLPRRVTLPEAVRSRGDDIVFPGVEPRPDFLVRKLLLDGEARIGRERFRFVGEATGLTTQPAVHGQPAVFRLAIDSGTPVQLEVTLDRTGETPQDKIVVNCPAIRHPARVLGNPKEFALAVSPGNTHVWASVELSGDSMTGQILVRQDPVELAPRVAVKYGGERLARNLREALAELRTIDLVLDLSGTLQKPEWKAHSDLGPKLAAAVNVLIAREIDHRKRELLALAESRLRDEVARLDDLLKAKEQELLAKLKLNEEEVRLVSQIIRQRVPGAEQVIGRELRQHLPLRF